MEKVQSAAFSQRYSLVRGLLFVISGMVCGAAIATLVFIPPYAMLVISLVLGLFTNTNKPGKVFDKLMLISGISIGIVIRITPMIGGAEIFEMLYATWFFMSLGGFVGVSARAAWDWLAGPISFPFG